jgi:hypothetical protein
MDSLEGVIPDAIDHQDTVTEPVRTAIVLKLLLAVAIILAIYLLSPGPIVLLFARAGIPWNSPVSRFAQAIYAPLIWLVEHVGSVEAFYRWYFSLIGLL